MQHPSKLLSISAELYLQRHLCKHGLYTTGDLNLADQYDKELYRQLSTLFPQDTFLHYEPLPNNIVRVWYLGEWKQNYASVCAKRDIDNENRRTRVIESEIIKAIAQGINIPLPDTIKESMAEGFYKTMHQENMQSVFKQFGIDINKIVAEVNERNKE